MTNTDGISNISQENQQTIRANGSNVQPAAQSQNTTQTSGARNNELHLKAQQERMKNMNMQSQIS